MVESVDTRDLKSLGHCGRVGSSPTSGTISDGPAINDCRPIVYFVPEVRTIPVSRELLHHFDDGLAQMLNNIIGYHAVGAVLLGRQVACQSVQIHTQHDRPIGRIVLGDE